MVRPNTGVSLSCLLTPLRLTLCNPMDCSTPVLPCPSPSPGVCSYSCPLSRWCYPTISSSVSPFSSWLQSFQGRFQWVGSLNQMAKVLELSFIISPSNEYSGLITFRMDWFDLLPVQGTFKSLLQHHSLKATVLQRWEKPVRELLINAYWPELKCQCGKSSAGARKSKTGER